MVCVPTPAGTMQSVRDVWWDTCGCSGHTFLLLRQNKKMKQKHQEKVKQERRKDASWPFQSPTMLPPCHGVFNVKF